SLWHLRWRMREFLAELVASTLLLAVGTSVNCQVKLSQSLSPSSAAGSYASQNWAWGLAVMCTIHLAGGISGAHANPGITISLAFFRGFPWRLVPSYLAAQLLGSFLGAALTYAMYLPSIERYQGAAGVGMRTIVGEGETGSLFTTVPAPYTTPASTFATELVASAILAMLVLCVGDESNSPPGDGMSGLIIGLAVTMIVSSGYAINAARDFGPRVFLSCVGYESAVWTHNSHWWLYGPIVGTIGGALLGCLVYDICIFQGEASPLNRR
ncbi:aquaporin-like protein, partial [Tilletiopsis washingtonensis]